MHPHARAPPQMENVLVVLPASSACKWGLVKRAVCAEAVAVDVKELQLALPGSFRHLADDVSGGGGGGGNAGRDVRVCNSAGVRLCDGCG